MVPSYLAFFLLQTTDIRSFMEKRSEEENTIDNKENSSINNDVSSMEKGEGQIDEPSKDK